MNGPAHPRSTTYLVTGSGCGVAAAAVISASDMTDRHALAWVITSLAASVICLTIAAWTAVTAEVRHIGRRLAAVERLTRAAARPPTPRSHQYLGDMAEAVRVGRELEKRRRTV